MRRLVLETDNTMKIKIGNKIYDPNDEPVMLILDDQDKANITAMLPEATKYCAFPDSMSVEEIEDWMAGIPSENKD